jgi:predicted DNA-binding protein (MmcQ/YjbR family)
MDIEKLRIYCLSKKSATEDFPFDESTLTFKVKEKMFCLVNIDNPDSINLKCDPEKAVEFREEYEEIIPGFHMNKKYWNTVDIRGTLKDSFICEMIDGSFDLVVETLTRKLRLELNEEYDLKFRIP